MKQTAKDTIYTTLISTKRWMTVQNLANHTAVKESTVIRTLNTLRGESRVKSLEVPNDTRGRKQWAEISVCEPVRKEVSLVPLTEIQRAYFAGYFDAEGNVSVDPTNNDTTWSASITFGQTNPIVIRRLHARYGSTLCFADSKNPAERPKLVFETSRWSTVRYLLTDIRPYVNEKRDQIEAVLQRFRPGMDRQNGKALCADLQTMKRRQLPHDLPITNIHDRRRRCSEESCNRRARARGFCTKHYQRARAAGRLDRISVNGRRLFQYGETHTDVDLAYFAGYFDGDGTFDVTARGRRWYVAVSFNQTQPQAVLRIAKVYGGSVRVKPGRTKSRRPQLRYYLAQQEAVTQFLRDVRPYLLEKVEEVDLLFQEFEPSMSASCGRALKRSLTDLRKRVHVGADANYASS